MKEAKSPNQHIPNQYTPRIQPKTVLFAQLKGLGNISLPKVEPESLPMQQPQVSFALHPNWEGVSEYKVPQKQLTVPLPAVQLPFLGNLKIDSRSLPCPQFSIENQPKIQSAEHYPVPSTPLSIGKQAEMVRFLPAISLPLAGEVKIPQTTVPRRKVKIKSLKIKIVFPQERKTEEQCTLPCDQTTSSASPVQGSLEYLPELLRPKTKREKVKVAVLRTDERERIQTAAY